MDELDVKELEKELISLVPMFPAVKKMKLKGNFVPWVLLNLAIFLSFTIAIWSDLLIDNISFKSIWFLIALIIFFISAIFLIQEEGKLNVEDKEIDEIQIEIQKIISKKELSSDRLNKLCTRIQPNGLLLRINQQYESLSSYAGLIVGWFMVTIFLITTFFGVPLIKVFNEIKEGSEVIIPFLLIVSFTAMTILYFYKFFLEIIDRFSGNFQRRVILQKIKDL